MKTRIKFCGITRLQDAEHAVQLGVDAIGFVFVKKSPRNITIQQAQHISEQLPPSVVRVGLFMNADANLVRQVLEQVRLNILQFHGEEDESFCNQFDLPYIKAISMLSYDALQQIGTEFPSATALLLDSHQKGEMGGSGQRFDWDLVNTTINKPIVLAGGLTPENVADAISKVKPYAVDVSSGIEASKGIKDPVKMERFIKEVHRD